MAKFLLRKTDSGQFNFSLKNDADKTLLKSEQYNSKASAQNGIESVRTHAPTAARYELKTGESGKFYFNLKSGNGQIVGTSVMYASEEARNTAVAETQAVAAAAGVVEDL